MADSRTEDAANHRLSDEAGDTTDDGEFPWPPNNRSRDPGHLRFSRTSYNLELSDPSSEESVAVEVGSDPDVSTFHLPANTLRASSEFFTRALKPEWTVEASRLIHLPEIDPALFDLYARWLATGADIMINEHDWKAEYTEYLKWWQEQEHSQESGGSSEKKLICPATVWDFELTTEAWFLGDYLQSRDFQNHCMGHLYYMHLRFDRLLSNEEFREETGEWPEEYWHYGTIAFVRPTDVLFTWRMTEHWNGATPFLLEQHPLRKFYIAWMKRYWDAYVLSDWDYEAQDGIVKLIDECPDLVYKHLRNCMVRKEPRQNIIMDVLGAYWVDVDTYPEATQAKVQDLVERAETHWGKTIWRVPAG